MSFVKVDVIPEGFAQQGAALHWDSSSQSLYYVDKSGPIINRYDMCENIVYTSKIDNEKEVTFIIPIKNKSTQFAVGLGNYIGIIEWDGTSTTCKVMSVITQVENDYKKNRFNYAKADPLGRFFAGTMQYVKNGNIFDVRRGKLYKLDHLGGVPKILKHRVAYPVGMAWNIKTIPNKFYFIDSCDYNIKEYEYCKKNGVISNPKVLHEFRINENARPRCLPSGLAIDSRGFLYVSGNGGGHIFIINPETGEMDNSILMPCEKITSIAFGGPNLNLLYATSSANDTDLSPAGETFVISNIGSTGMITDNLEKIIL